MLMTIRLKSHFIDFFFGICLDGDGPERGLVRHLVVQLVVVNGFVESVRPSPPDVDGPGVVARGVQQLGRARLVDVGVGIDGIGG